MSEHSDFAQPVVDSPPWFWKVRTGRFFLLLASFAVLGALVGLGVTSVPDDAASRYFKSIEGNPNLDIAMVAITTTGDASFLVVVGIVLTVIRRTRKAGMVFLIAIVVIAVTVMYIKPLVGRAVPPYDYQPAIKLPSGTIESDSLAPFAAGFSFPSGHAARATALAFILGFAAYQRSHKVAYAIWAFPVIIGITRVYLLQHYPSDIVGGMIFGFIISVVLARTMKLEQPFSMNRFKKSEGKRTPSPP
ncbi:MAG: phosphatase PAP2 family protein [Nitrososphaera sp.]